MGLLYTYGKNGVPHDDKKALEWFKKAAAQNEAFAQYNIAIAYGLGKGVPRDFDKQREWLEKSAAQNFAPAEKMLKELDGISKAYGNK
ncbi:Putative beta-lactamase hcpD precursor [Cardiobacterium hominis]|uniref:Sel1 repeat protein n=2 Tax=Cardiobacterium hominis TaxID=2718 RepID=C8N9L5_CARH6|nr:Sel1 repeat protein [Cardiobacterium hominis ATCC 15826]VEG76283.1 Putative beta-lactamase hcpD precursor [Cardiobacterium hominis]